MLTVRSRPGVTLIELIVGLVVAAVVGTAAMTIQIRNEHLAFALGQITASRRALREGADVLRYDLRNTAPQHDAIYSMGDTYVDFRMSTGFSILCGLDSSRTLLVFPARTSSAPNLTSWITAPEAGDTVMIFAAHATGDSTRWYTHSLGSSPTSGHACSSDFIAAGTGEPALALRVTTPVSADAGPGAALRFVRRARYELYKAGDGAWYLGFRDCLSTRATSCATVQPVSGPYTSGGLRFLFLDSAGTPTSDAHRVARIDVMLRAESAARLHLPGIASGMFADSILFTIRPRR